VRPDIIGRGSAMKRMLTTHMATYLRGFLYLGCLIFLGAAVLCLVGLKGEDKLIGLGFLPFFSLGVTSIVGYGSVSIDNERLISRCWLGSYNIKWNEIEKVWIDGSRLNLILEGQGKRVAIAGPAAWAGPDKSAMIMLMNRKLAEGGIAPELNGLKALLISNRAAKV